MFQPTSSLTVANAKSVLEQGLRALASGENKVDLANLATVDSSAVAVLLAWRRAATARGMALTFDHVPASLLSLAQLYGVAELLALQPA